MHTSTTAREGTKGNKMFTVKIQNLRRPVSMHPGATMKATLILSYADGSTEETGAWFGSDRADLHALVTEWHLATTKE